MTVQRFDSWHSATTMDFGVLHDGLRLQRILGRD